MEKLEKLRALTITNTGSDDAKWQPPPGFWDVGFETESPNVEVNEGKPNEETSFPPSTNTEKNDLTNGQQPELGQRAEEGLAFTPLSVIKKYPYMYIGVANSQRVAETFFDRNKLLDNNIWDVYYLHRSLSKYENNPILLIPTAQFERLLDNINEGLDLRLSIPSGEASHAYNFTFKHDGTPTPRHLGRSTSSAEVDELKMNVPPNSYRLSSEHETIPEDRSLMAFKEKIAFMLAVQKAKRAANKERAKVTRVANQQSWCNAIKSVQRYLGLRECRKKQPEAMAKSSGTAGLSSTNTTFVGSVDMGELPPTTFSPRGYAPFNMETDVVFVCVDVEAYERDSSKITEIGIATLDTRDLKSLLPLERGKGWFTAIRSRHFRISEYKNYINTEFVAGCPTAFDFGTSEFISIKDAPRVVASCFKPPFSAPEGLAQDFQEVPKRNIILVGHDVIADVNYLKNLGYDVYNLSNLIEQVDTASMWRYCTRDSNPRNLGSILSDLDIPGWNLHNAGNDATFTLQAMISIAIKHIVDKEKARTVKESEKSQRIAVSVAEATANAIDREDGWSSAGDSDGGGPVKPKAPPASKSGSRKAYVSDPWTDSNAYSGKKPHTNSKALREGNFPKKWAGDQFDPWSKESAPAVPHETKNIRSTKAVLPNPASYAQH